MEAVIRTEPEALIEIGEGVMKKALSLGADVAEVVVGEGLHLSAKVRLGEPELVEEAGSRGVGVRVMVGQQVAVTHTSDTSEAGIRTLVEDAIELARLSQPDPFAGPADPSLLSSREEHLDLDTYDESVHGVDAKEALRRAAKVEAAAFAFDPRIKKSEGATFGRISGARAIVTSGGFRGLSRGTYASMSVSPVVDDADKKKRSGSYWSAKRHLADLLSEEEVGEEAARRALAKLGARKVPTQEVPVIFSPEVGRSILGLLAGCINGGAIWRKSSYLLDREGTEIASPLVTVVDDPLLPRAPGSRPYDGEGLLSRRSVVVEQGVLRTYMLDSYAGRKLQKASTASASRGSGGGVGPSVSNFLLQPGEMSPEELLASTDEGLYITEMMGFGFNAVTGDFSRGASGFWVEKGVKTFPVSEVTVSLNLDLLLKRIDAVADDLILRTSVATPTFRVSAMTVAGS